MASLDENVFANHVSIVAGFLRNGPAAAVVRTARESAIAPKYHWNCPTYDAAYEGANGIAKLPVSILIDVCCRSAFVQIVQQRVVDAEAAHNVANAGAAVPAVFDEDPVWTTATGDPTARLEAISIGSARAAAIVSFRIQPNDLVATETVAPIFVMVAPAAENDADRYRALIATATAGWRASLASGHARNAATKAEEVTFTFVPMTADESDLAFRLFSLGQAAPVRAGAQIFTDGHHYHGDETSSARHRAIENEVFTAASPSVALIWSANRQVIRNAVWHAAIHPINMTILQGFAEDPTVTDRLNATGYGSMSVGLPAQEDLFKRAAAYKAVLNAVGPVLTRHGHTVSMPNLNAAVTTLGGLPRLGALPANRPALPGLPEAAWPANCTTRANALNLFLTPYLEAAEPIAAWLYGFFTEICSDAQIRRNSAEGSLLRSYALRRAMANNIASVNEAQAMYRARARFVRVEAEKGNLETFQATA